MPTTRTTDRRVAVLSLLAAGVVAALVIARGCGSEDDKSAAAPSASASNSNGPSAGASAPQPSVSILPVDSPTMAKITSIAKLEQVLADYQAQAMYPVWSRPHDEGTKYKLEWNKPSVSDLPLSDEAPLYYRFGADRAHVAYGEPYTAWIEAWEGNDDTKKIPVKITDGFVMTLSGPKPGRVVTVQFKDDGLNGDEKAGDHRYTVRFVPSDIPELRTALQTRLQAVIETGKAKRLAVREFTYSPRPVVLVESITDSIKEGNLVVTLNVDVREKGIYGFEANLMSGDGQTPVAWAKENRTLEAGKQAVECRFFGKIFHDKGVDGPYLVKDIRGFLRFNDDKEMPIWWKHEGTHLTKGYKPVDFSSKEWDDPEKTQTIDRMKQMIADTKAGKIGQPTEKPKHIHIDENGKATEVP